MPYRIGAKGSNGCSGYPALKDTGEVMGCHKTRSEAAAQIYAINRSEGNIGKAMVKVSGLPTETFSIISEDKKSQSAFYVYMPEKDKALNRRIRRDKN